MKINKKKIIDIIGKVLIIISLIIIGFQIYKYKVDFSSLNNFKTIINLIILVIIQGLLTFLPPLFYNLILRVFCEKKVSFPIVSYYYLKANLYKYLPGNVMHYVGRNQLAVDYDLPHSKVICATVSEILLILLAGGVITLSMSFSYFVEWVNTNNINLLLFILIGIIVLLIIFLIFRKKLIELIKKYKEIFIKKGIKTYLLSFAFYCVHFVLSGLLFSFIFILFCGNVSLNQFFVISGLSVMAWIVGFITPGVPGGIGVREAVMIMFLSNIAPVEKILTTVIIYRIVCILGDILAFIYSIIFKKINNKSLNQGVMN